MPRVTCYFYYGEIIWRFGYLYNNIKTTQCSLHQDTSQGPSPKEIPLCLVSQYWVWNTGTCSIKGLTVLLRWRRRGKCLEFSIPVQGRSIIFVTCISTQLKSITSVQRWKILAYPWSLKPGPTWTTGTTDSPGWPNLWTETFEEITSAQYIF